MFHLPQQGGKTNTKVGKWYPEAKSVVEYTTGPVSNKAKFVTDACIKLKKANCSL